MVGARLISVVTSSVSGAPSRTAHTPSVIGSSISRRCARSRRTGAVVRPSDDHADLGSGLVGTRAARDELSGATVPARRRPARDDEVAHPGEPRERVRARARRLGESPHLREPARDERGLRVVSEREAVGASRRERDHVLRCRTQLDAHDVVAHVDAEENGVHRDLQPHGELEVVARDDGCRRQAADDLVRDVRPGENGHRPAADETREPLPGGRIEPLREAEERRVAGKLRDDGAEHTARHGDDDELGVVDAGASSIVAAAIPSSRASVAYRGFRPVRFISSACSGSRAASVTSWPLSRR